MRAALHAAGVRSEVDGVAGTARISAPTAIEVMGAAAKPKQRASGSKRRASAAAAADEPEQESDEHHQKTALPTNIEMMFSCSTR